MSPAVQSKPEHDRVAQDSTNPGFVRRTMELIALWGLAVVVPLLDTIRQAPDFWVARKASYLHVTVFLLILVLAAPILLATIEWLVSRLSQRASFWLHLIFLYGLTGLLVLPIVDKVSGGVLSAYLVAFLSAMLAFALVLAYKRLNLVREYVVFLVIAPVAITALFIVSLPDLAEASGDVDLYSADVSSDGSVTVVVFDATAVAALVNSDMEIDAVDFPNFGRLAEISNWYPMATSVYSHTNLAVPAIVAGIFPELGNSPVYSNYPQNLFTLLASTHRIDAIEATTNLCPTNVCDMTRVVENRSWMRSLASDATIVYSHLVTPTTARWRLAPINKQWGSFGDTPTADVGTAPPDGFEHEIAIATNGEARASSFGAFLDGFSANEGPTVHYGHIEFPHGPWEYLPDGRQYGFPDWMGIDTATDEWLDNAWYVQQGYQRYRWQLGYADHLLGMMLDRLEMLDLLDDMTIVVTSDHGNAFVPDRPQRAYTDETAGSIMGVPLFVKLPNQQIGKVLDVNAETVDIVPTIIDILGGETPEPTDGYSLIATGWTRSTKSFLSDSNQIVEMSDKEYSGVLMSAINQLNEMQGTESVLGPRPELIGMSIDRLDIRQVPGAVEFWTSDSYPNLFSEVGEAPSRIPANIRATVTIDDGQVPGSFAVILDGVVVASTVAYQVDGNRVTVGALVDPNRLHAGPVNIEIAGVVGDGDVTELIRYVS